MDSPRSPSPAETALHASAPVFDLTAMQRSLLAEPPAQAPPWLEESRRHPEVFWQTLSRELERRNRRALGTEVFRRYAFFQDLAARHRSLETPAIRWFDPAAGRREMAYADLEARAWARADRWKGSGAGPEQVLCIIRDLGPEYLVDLLAALCIGMIVSTLPPLGSRYLRGRLAILSPDFIAAEDRLFSGLGEWRGRHLSGSESGAPKRGGEGFRPAVYASNAPVLRCFDPAGLDPHIPADVPADALFCGALRDGMLLMGLGPGRALAAPGSHVLETQPFLLLAALINGATFIHIERSRVAKNPKLLTEFPLKALRVSEPLRDILMENPVDLGDTCRFWFKNPALRPDRMSWERFVQRCNLGNVPAADLKPGASAGGCALFSFDRGGDSPGGIHPVPGIPWRLTDPLDRESTAEGAFGALTFDVPWGDSETPLHLPILLIESGGRRQYAGSLHPGRSGRTFPREEVLGALQEIYRGKDFFMAAPPGPLGIDTVVVIGVLQDPEEAQEMPVQSRLLKERLLRDFGADFLPDRIRIYPLRARRHADGAIDHRWCEDHFLSRGLERRARSEIQRSLSSIRTRLYR